MSNLIQPGLRRGRLADRLALVLLVTLLAVLGVSFGFGIYSMHRAENTNEPNERSSLIAKYPHTADLFSVPASPAV
jgi:hypothetical protein